MKLVSLCLVGCPCRYDGRSRTSKWVIARLGEEPLIPICPENMAGFPTPRPRVHIEGGSGGDVLDGRARVVREDGRDVTDAMLGAAQAVVRLKEALGISGAYLKEGSPSCGFSRTAGPGGPRPGMGVIAAALHRTGVQVVGVE